MIDFKGRSILSVLDFTREEMDHVFQVAERIEKLYQTKRKTQLCADAVIGVLFFQPSTRTRLSFESAAQRLGGSVIGFASPEVSRAGDKFKESMADTAKVIGKYVDAIVIRHTDENAVAEFARHIDIPVINAGNGHVEHPTQALLDLYTIKREKGRIDDLNVLLVGNMNWRTLHSLPFALAKYQNVNVSILCPDTGEKAIPVWVQKTFDDLNLNYRRITALDEVVRDVDVIYDETLGLSDETTPGRFILSKEKLLEAKDDLIILHPLPRADELSVDVDSTPYARYFEQVFYGLIVRMALLTLVLGKADQLDHW